MSIRIFAARRIITMNPARPYATHVAVRDGRVLGAGSLAELQGWGEARVDEQFANKILMPGLVEGHSHLMEGALWAYTYVGFHDRVDPDGRTWPGARSIDEVIDRLREASLGQTDDLPIIGWGFDPIHLGEARCSRHDLDRVNSTRPVAVWHASLHIVNANTAALKLADYLRPGLHHPGLPLGPDGLPTGEVKGPDTMLPLAARLGQDWGLMMGKPETLKRFARLCVLKGVTTATDLANPLPEEALPDMFETSSQPGFPTRIVSLLRYLGGSPEAAAQRATELRARSTDRLRLGMIKVVADGSIQGFSARLRWPGYYRGQANGLWYLAPEQIQKALSCFLEHGIRTHIHTNGDEATEAVLDAMQTALARHPRPGHRFTLQHCQLADAAQMRRAAELGMCVNLFANHLYYWGEAHYAQTVGPERASRMNACRTALDCGLPLAIHSDAPITPLGPLFTAWCAVNRQTSSGRVLGEAERISVPEALRAITLGAAYTLGLDGEIGSIETGKRADFAVLEDDPEQVAVQALKDIRVTGVVAGGEPFMATAL